MGLNTAVARWSPVYYRGATWAIERGWGLAEYGLPAQVVVAVAAIEIGPDKDTHLPKPWHACYD